MITIGIIATLWIFMGFKSYCILVDEYRWNDFVCFPCALFAPAMMLVALSLVVKDIDYSPITKYLKFNKKTPIVDGYKWGDLITYGMRDGIFVYETYNGKYSVLLKGETQLSCFNKEDVEPVITGEVAEELRLFKEAQELERKGKEFIAQAEKVRKQQAKVKNILN